MAYERSLRIATCALALWIVGALAPVGSAERVDTVPHLVICELKGTQYFLWLDRVMADGSAAYMTPSGTFLQLSKEGVMIREAAVKGNCAGKTMQELIDNGQARFLGE